MRNLLLCILAFGLVGSVGCTGMEPTVSTEDALDKVNQGKGIHSNVPQCLVDYEVYELDAELTSFEIYSKKNFEFGFNLASGLLKLLGISFKTEKGVMTMHMGLSETIDPTDWVSNVKGEAMMRKKDFRFNIGIDMFNGGLGYFKQTPMSKLTTAALNNGLSKLEQDLIAKGATWNTRVVYSSEEDKKVIVPIGRMSGVQPGDTFKIFNVNYIWKDQPCDSELLMPDPTTTEPLAVVQAVTVRNNATTMRIIEKNYEDPIELGAMVEINMLQGENRQLLQPVRIRDLNARPLPIEGVPDVDLSAYLGAEIRTLLYKHGFHPRT